MKGRTTVLVLYYLFALPLITGFYFHQSPWPAIFSYDKQYFIFLVVFTLVVGIAVPFLLWRFITKNGVKPLLFSLVPAMVVLVIAYLFFSIKYYDRRNHPSLFEPFVQVHRPELNLEDFQEDDFIVLALGGSTTRNERVAPELRYPKLVEQQLRELYPSLNVKVINAGMDWYTTKHSLINYVTYYRQLKPDMVIIMHAINDVYRSFSPKEVAIGEYNPDYAHFYGPSFRGAAERPTFEEHLWNGFTKGWFSSYFHPYPRDIATDFPLEVYKSIDAYKHYLSTLVDVVQKDSTICLVLEQRSLYKENLSPEEDATLFFTSGFCKNNDGKFANYISLNRAMKHYNKAAMQIARQHGAGYIRVGNRIESSLKYFRDDVHYTEEGTRTLAQTVVEYIRDSVALQAPLQESP